MQPIVMKYFFIAFLFLSLTACSQNKSRRTAATSSKATMVATGLPLGKYSVYQSGGYGSFNYQYAFYILNNHQYKMYDKTGEYTYSPATHAVRFTSGEIGDYTGVFTQVKYNNSGGKQMIVLDFWGKGEIPDTTQLQHKPLGNYQYAYYQAGEK